MGLNLVRQLNIITNNILQILEYLEPLEAPVKV